MNPLSGLFGIGVRARNALYDRGLVKSQHLQGPVVSIGNLCIGGTGKTPFTQLLGDLLLQRGVAFDVLSRGYGRTSTEIKVVDPNGRSEEFGDEPLLLAKHFRSRQIPNSVANIVVGTDRYEAGLEAERLFGPQLHLLDDGFQHRRLERDFDIVLLAPDDSAQVLLPVGRLREPLAALKRADAVVATEAVKLAEFPMLPSRVWRVEREIVLPSEFRTDSRPLAFCGIARPDRFFSDLRRNGIFPKAELTFRDHHRYSEKDVARIAREKSSSGADCCLTTIKDIMNLGALAHRVAPIYAVGLTLKLADADTVVDEMLRTIEQRKKGRRTK